MAALVNQVKQRLRYVNNITSAQYLRMLYGLDTMASRIRRKLMAHNAVTLFTGTDETSQSLNFQTESGMRVSPILYLVIRPFQLEREALNLNRASNLPT
jgi:hypothetical protein